MRFQSRNASMPHFRRYTPIALATILSETVHLLQARLCKRPGTSTRVAYDLTVVPETNIVGARLSSLTNHVAGATPWTSTNTIQLPPRVVPVTFEVSLGTIFVDPCHHRILQIHVSPDFIFIVFWICEQGQEACTTSTLSFHTAIHDSWTILHSTMQIIFDLTCWLA